MELRESELSLDKWVKIWQVYFFLETEKKKIPRSKIEGAVVQS